MLSAFGALDPHKSGVDAIASSLVANAACYLLVSLCILRLDWCPYTRICTHWSRICWRQLTWRYGILNDGIAKECCCVSSVDVGCVCEIDIAASKKVLV